MKLYSEAAMERAMKVQEVILRAMRKRITWWQAAEIIGISARQMRRWRRRYEQEGYDGLYREGKAAEFQFLGDTAGLMRIVKHKKGRVSRCILHQRPGDPRPTPLSVYLGTCYSYLEGLDSGRLVWALRKLRQGGGVPLALLQLISESSEPAQERAQLAHVAPEACEW